MTTMTYLYRAGLLALFMLTASSAASQSATLEPFAPFIGGEWRLDDTVQTFERGPGRTSVIARGYTERNGEQHLVSHGLWYWQPEAGEIQGRATATGMPVALFEYVTRFEDNVVLHNLNTYGPEGEPGVFVETWTLTGPDTYEWRLLLLRPDATEVVMSGTFVRRPEDP